jgi:hypothetical protein
VFESPVSPPHGRAVRVAGFEKAISSLSSHQTGLVAVLADQDGGGAANYIIVDRHRLAYLNGIEKLNCAYSALRLIWSGLAQSSSITASTA